MKRPLNKMIYKIKFNCLPVGDKNFGWLFTLSIRWYNYKLVKYAHRTGYFKVIDYFNSKDYNFEFNTHFFGLYRFMRFF